MNYLTREQVAARLHVSVRTVSTYVKQGLLSPPARLGRRPLWTEGCIEDDVERARCSAGAEKAEVARTDPKRIKRKPGRPRKA
ncbi:MAG: helix-turn-helix domain-containing protein [Burkholderiaceae bacterium]|nr:helix-turn-helix domain-containing protein [Burkholderiaceae bacterium]